MDERIGGCMMGVLKKVVKSLAKAAENGIDVETAASNIVDMLSASELKELKKELKAIKTAEAIRKHLRPYAIAGAAFAGGFLSGLENLLKQAESGKIDFSDSVQKLGELAWMAVAATFPKVAQDIAELGEVTPEAAAGVVPPETNELVELLSATAPKAMDISEEEEEEGKDPLQKQIEEAQKVLNDLQAAQKQQANIPNIGTMLGALEAATGTKEEE